MSTLIQNIDHPWPPATAPKIVTRLGTSRTQCAQLLIAPAALTARSRQPGIELWGRLGRRMGQTPMVVAAIGKRKPRTPVKVAGLKIAAGFVRGHAKSIAKRLRSASEQ
jgi:hypothetical protein